MSFIVCIVDIVKRALDEYDKACTVTKRILSTNFDLFFSNSNFLFIVLDAVAVHLYHWKADKAHDLSLVFYYSVDSSIQSRVNSRYTRTCPTSLLALYLQHPQSSASQVILKHDPHSLSYSYTDRWRHAFSARVRQSTFAPYKSGDAANPFTATNFLSSLKLHSNPQDCPARIKQATSSVHASSNFPFSYDEFG